MIGVKYTDEQSALLDKWIVQSRECYWWFPYEGFVFCSERPTILNVDERGRLHSLREPAMAFADGYKLYSSHGVRLPEWIVEQPELITVEKIDAEANAEVRRVMIERFGMQRYVTESGAVSLDKSEWGELLKRDLVNDEPIVVVSVLNSTPEPDGTIKRYMLRVQPELRPMLSDGTLGAPQKMTALNAIASTFGKRGEDYSRMVAMS